MGWPDPLTDVHPVDVQRGQPRGRVAGQDQGVSFLHFQGLDLLFGEFRNIWNKKPFPDIVNVNFQRHSNTSCLNRFCLTARTFPSASQGPGPTPWPWPLGKAGSFPVASSQHLSPCRPGQEPGMAATRGPASAPGSTPSPSQVKGRSPLSHPQAQALRGVTAPPTCGRQL